MYSKHEMLICDHLSFITITGNEWLLCIFQYVPHGKHHMCNWRLCAYSYGTCIRVIEVSEYSLVVIQ